MTKIMVSFEFDGDVAQITKLLSGLENPMAAVTNVEPVKVVKPRKIRVLTDEQKAAFRARMIAGREAKAIANGSKPVSKPEPKVEPVVASAPVKPVAKPKLLTKVPMLRTGRKVKAMPSAK